MSNSIFQSCSQMSTDIRCSNCGVNIISIIWKQCNICHQFNLCKECADYPYEKLEVHARGKHTRYHNDLDPITDQCLQLISMQKIPDLHEHEKFQKQLDTIVIGNQIQNDLDMSIVMRKLKEINNDSSSESEQIKRKLSSMVVDYHMRAFDRNIRILNLDGGGVRGYMPIRILEELITKQYFSHEEHSNIDRTKFREAQSKFTNQFDYFAGTSTGGIIAFCLAIDYSILDLKDIYTRASYYFQRNRLGPLFYAKYNPSRIHAKIDEIINGIQLKNGKKLSAEHATLLDIHNYLNPDAMIPDEYLKSPLVRHGNLLEFVDGEEGLSPDDDTQFRRVKREKVLLITAYNATKDIITIFNTSYEKHWPYRIADVIKATMAAPTYFPPQKISKGIVEHGQFIANANSSELFVDGGIFANDPELIALWAIRMQWKKLNNYRIVSIGTGTYNTPIISLNAGGYFGWLFNNGLLINTLMQANSSLTEVVSSNLAKLNNIKRMKFNYKLTEAMGLDDANFVKIFDNEWEQLKSGADFQALVLFLEKYIK